MFANVLIGGSIDIRYRNFNLAADKASHPGSQESKITGSTECSISKMLFVVVVVVKKKKIIHNSWKCPVYPVLLEFAV